MYTRCWGGEKAGITTSSNNLHPDSRSTKEAGSIYNPPAKVFEKFVQEKEVQAS
jgi:hypothetical protein